MDLCQRAYESLEHYPDNFLNAVNETKEAAKSIAEDHVQQTHIDTTALEGTDYDLKPSEPAMASFINKPYGEEKAERTGIIKSVATGFFNGIKTALNLLSSIANVGWNLSTSVASNAVNATLAASIITAAGISAEVSENADHTLLMQNQQAPALLQAFNDIVPPTAAPAPALLSQLETASFGDGVGFASPALPKQVTINDPIIDRSQTRALPAHNPSLTGLTSSLFDASEDIAAAYEAPYALTPVETGNRVFNPDSFEQQLLAALEQGDITDAQLDPKITESLRNMRDNIAVPGHNPMQAFVAARTLVETNPTPETMAFALMVLKQIRDLVPAHWSASKFAAQQDRHYAFSEPEIYAQASAKVEQVLNSESVLLASGLVDPAANLIANLDG